MTPFSWKGRAAALAIMALAVGVVSPPVRAVPSFARRYGTSCQTCHVAFPKLTPFGEAFRRNSYRFPGGLDEDYRRQEPQKLGADAYKDLFPFSVWPGEIPAQLPVSALAGATAIASPESTTAATRASVSGTVGVNAAANLGDWFSAWIGLSAMVDSSGKTAVNLERAFFVVSPGAGPWGNLRVGLFEPGLFSFSMHRTFGLAPWILTTKVKDNAFVLEPTQLGLEWTGTTLDGRGAFTLGVAEGAGNQVGPPADVYARFATKLGGMRLDGESSSGDVKLADPAPWREWSVLVGAFGYAGRATLGDLNIVSQNDHFGIVGFDVNAQLRDANLILAYSFARNLRPSIAEPNRSFDTHNLMAQLDYVVFPWLIPAVRLERRIQSGVTEDRLMPMLYVLWRANIRTQAWTTLQRSNTGKMTWNTAQVGLNVAF